MKEPHRTLMLLVVVLSCLTAAPAAGQGRPQEHVLDNGMRFLLLPRRFERGTVSAAWVAKVGSVDERPGETGLNLFLQNLLQAGPTTVAAGDVAADVQFLQLEAALSDRLRELHLTVQRERFERGEIDDPWNPIHDTGEMHELRRELLSVLRQHAQIIRSNDFEPTYIEAGAGGLNAFASHDLTMFSLSMSRTALETWAKQESQRLDDPVFRRFHAEHAMAYARRVQVVQSTPTGALDREFDALFWQSSPYAAPVVGRVGDLEGITRDQLVEFFGRYYQPANLVGVIVGDFSPEQIKPVLAETFGRLAPGRKTPAAPATGEPPSSPDARMSGECACPPRLEMRFRTVAFNHPDSFVLEVIAELLNASDSRLASGVRAGQISRRAGGYFFLSAEIGGETTPEAVEQAWAAALARLGDEPVPIEELEHVRRRIAAGAETARQTDAELIFQLGVYEAMGDWRYTYERVGRLLEVTSEDVMRVAKIYFPPANRAVAAYSRQEGGGTENPLADLPPRVRAQFEQTLQRLLSYDHPDDLRRAVEDFQANLKRAPEQIRPALAYIIERLEQRVAELEGDRNP